ncbi:hypothetical protein MNB_SV-13-400 [hydrothermal vent metagenome]|uniref:Uncharacterized protein n=1 Tax=hydrothermal vent metagenome TaxID=652676 RepID=A0A1W1D0Q0_9ZZZZ
MEVLREKLVADKIIKTPVPYGKIIVVGAIIGLSKKKGFCYAKNSNIENKNGLSELLKIDVGTLKNYLTSLEKDEIIYRYYAGKERRLRISKRLIEKYPEIKQIITDESQIITDESQIITDESQIITNESQIIIYAYYIYKVNKSISKLKENKNKDFWLVNLEDESFKNWLKTNSLDYKQSQKKAFDAISTFYPVASQTKGARVAFEKLEEVELKELFESMPMFLDHVTKQREKNFLANEHEYKYIQKFVNYISEKSFKNYQKKFQKERTFGIDEFEAFLERVEEYAYEMDANAFFVPSPADEHLDFKQLQVIVWNCKTKARTIEELRPFCRTLTGFKEEVAS